MKQAVSATEARIHFGELMRRVVERDEPVIVERGGKPEVVILSVAEYERLRANQPSDWRTRLDAVHALIRHERGDKPLPPPEEIIRAMREERDEQLFGNLR
ncbi:MAG: type II toxin-antitoxin system Phd/YefM family antitoxin [Thermomicrobia bacterium]|nr:type II toxin-antitoxin system Phd/YefM family antitoxin [Thermomicrobia bacterium]